MSFNDEIEALAKATTVEEQMVKSLVNKLNQYAHEYYVLDAPTVTDEHYDKLFRALQDLETRHPDLVLPNSPTLRIGGAAVDQFEKVPHDAKMYSLDNVFSDYTKEDRKEIHAEFLAWVNKTAEQPLLAICLLAERYPDMGSITSEQLDQMCETEEQIRNLLAKYK